MKLIDIINAAEGRVSDGEKFMWNCWGEHARYMEFVDADGLEFCSAIFDTKTFDVYIVDLYVPGTDQCFRWFNPGFKDAYLQESKMRNIDPMSAWGDNVFYEELTDNNQLIEYTKDISATYYDNLPILETR